MPRPSRRSEYAEQVGAWIQTRRIDLGMTQKELAEAVGDSERTVRNAESGAHAVAQLSRPKWERALGWPAWSLTTAYLHGQPPAVPTPEADPERKRIAAEQARVLAAHAERVRILTAADIPADLYRDPEVAEILDAQLPEDAAVLLLRAWHKKRLAHAQYVDMLDTIRRRKAQ